MLIRIHWWEQGFIKLLLLQELSSRYFVGGKSSAMLKVLQKLLWNKKKGNEILDEEA